jgi:hypothetical protein
MSSKISSCNENIIYKYLSQARRMILLPSARLSHRYHTQIFLKYTVKANCDIPIFITQGKPRMESIKQWNFPWMESIELMINIQIVTFQFINTRPTQKNHSPFFSLHACEGEINNQMGLSGYQQVLGSMSFIDENGRPLRVCDRCKVSRKPLLSALSIISLFSYSWNLTSHSLTALSFISIAS